jgi:hypothetical protein
VAFPALWVTKSLSRSISKCSSPIQNSGLGHAERSSEESEAIRATQSKHPSRRFFTRKSRASSNYGIANGLNLFALE